MKLYTSAAVARYLDMTEERADAAGQGHIDRIQAGVVRLADGDKTVHKFSAAEEPGSGRKGGL